MKSLLFVLVLCFGMKVFAHGDHSSPGAIPPAPHGGTLKEAKHKHKSSHVHDHKDAAEREIFFEVIKRGNNILVYPMELDPKTSKKFIALNPAKFRNTKIDLYNPRKRKRYNPKVVPSAGAWKLSLDGVKGRRFFVKIKTILKGGSYKASIQIETR